MEEADNQAKELGDRAINVNYEELLNNPADTLDKICGFCGLTVTKDKRLKAAVGLNPARAFAYLKTPVLKKFAEENQTRLERW